MLKLQLKRYQISIKKIIFKKPPLTFLVHEADIETIDYNDGSDENMFTKESNFIAKNKIFDMHKKEQAENNLDEAETINYVDDTNLTNVKENKNAK